MSQSGLVNITSATPAIPTLFVADVGNAIPVANTLNVLGGDGVTTTGAGSTITIEVETDVAQTYTTDSGSAVPAAGILNVLGSGSITTSGAGSTVTTQLTGLTNHAVLVGAGTSTITKVGPTATAGQVLQSAGAAADPAFSTATYPSTTTVSQLLYSSSANVVSGLATANSAALVTNSTGVPVYSSTMTNGQLIIGSTGATPTAGTLTAGTYASITNAAGSITVDAATTAKWIVSGDGLNCTHTTIASALTAASSGQTIFVRPGTYTENLTLKAGVNITAYSTDSSFNATGVVKIVGKCTFTAAGTVTISGIELKTNSDYFLEVSGSAASIVNLIECSLNASNNTGINFSSSSSSAKITCITCYADVGTTGIALHTSSSAGAISYVYCQLVTTGPTSTVSNNSAGSSGYYYTLASIPIGCTSTGGITCLYCDINTNDRNITAITVNGSGTNVIRDTSVTSGTASAISIGGNNCALVGCNIGSSNTNAVTGAGTLTLIAACNFTSSSKYINTTTQTTVGGVQGYAGSGTNNVGMIGERVSSYASGVALTSTITANITSIALTPGIWDITGICQMTFSVAGQACIVGISATSATVAGNPGDQYTVTSLAVNAGVLYGTVPAWRVQLTANTTYYLVAQSAHSAGNCTAEGRISAVRAG